MLLCLFCQHAARYLANQDWVKNDSLKTVKNTAVIPLLSLKLLIVIIYLISVLFILISGKISFCIFFLSDSYYYACGGSTTGCYYLISSYDTVVK